MQRKAEEVAQLAEVAEALQGRNAELAQASKDSEAVAEIQRWAGGQLRLVLCCLDPKCGGLIRTWSREGACLCVLGGLIREEHALRTVPSTPCQAPARLSSSLFGTSLLSLVWVHHHHLFTHVSTALLAGAGSLTAS